MFEMNVPYDKGQMKIKLEDKNLAGVLEGRQSDYKTTLSENEIVEQSLNNPIGSKSLEELAKGKKNIVIISSDHTRPVPSKIITPILLRRIRSFPFGGAQRRACECRPPVSFRGAKRRGNLMQAPAISPEPGCPRPYGSPC